MPVRVPQPLDLVHAVIGARQHQVGVGPLKELYEALDKHDAYNGVCIAAGGFSDAARQFAAGKPLTLLEGAELAKLLGRLPN